MSKEPPSHEALAREHGFDSAKQVGNVLTNVLRTFKQKWKDVLIEDVGKNNERGLADALHDARLSVRMARYIDFSRLLSQAMHRSPRSTEPADLLACHVDETTYQGILDLATDGFDQLLPIEQSLLFETHLRTPIGLLLGTDSSAGFDETIADQHLEDILAQATPDPKCLESLAKLFKRSIRGGSGVHVPASIAGVLRLALIALADTRCGRTITSVPRQELTTAMNEVVAFPWIDERCRGLIQTYLDAPPSSDSSAAS